MKKQYALQITYVDEIDLSDEIIKEFFDFPNDYEITEEDRKMYFYEYYVPEFLENHKLQNMNVFNCEYVHD